MEEQETRRRTTDDGQKETKTVKSEKPKAGVAMRGLPIALAASGGPSRVLDVEESNGADEEWRIEGELKRQAEDRRWMANKKQQKIQKQRV